MLDKYKIRDKYYHIVVDGTGLATSRKRYNEKMFSKQIKQIKMETNIKNIAHMC